MSPDDTALTFMPRGATSIAIDFTILIVAAFTAAYDCKKGRPNDFSLKAVSETTTAGTDIRN